MNDSFHETGLEMSDTKKADDEDAEHMKQAFAMMPSAEKLKNLMKTKPAPATWFEEEFNRPAS